MYSDFERWLSFSHLNREEGSSVCCSVEAAKETASACLVTLDSPSLRNGIKGFAAPPPPPALPLPPFCGSLLPSLKLMRFLSRSCEAPINRRLFCHLGSQVILWVFVQPVCLPDVWICSPGDQQLLGLEQLFPAPKDAHHCTQLAQRVDDNGCV
uniref:Uncharacterized protein n=1 Tax=Sphaerodactylus townsendi TaxID=933632 RepID=A0ACB8FTR1_9SAUR